MLNRSAEPHEPRDSTRVLEVLSGKLDIKRHLPGILYVYFVHLQFNQMNTIVFQWIASYQNNMSSYLMTPFHTNITF